MNFKNMAILCMGLALLGTVSCTEEPCAPDTDSFSLPVIVAQYPSIDLPQDTKSEAGEVVYNTYWNVGDELAVVNVTQAYRVDKYVSRARIKTLPGTGEFEAVGNPTYRASDLVYAVYPYSAVSLIDDGGVTRLANNKLTVSLTDNLSYTSKTNSPMFSQNDIQVSTLIRASTLRPAGDPEGFPGITMTRLTGMIRILSHISSEELSALSINAVTLYATGIAGSQDVTFSSNKAGGRPSLVRAGGGSQRSITINLPGQPKVASTAAIAEFIPIFPIWVGKDDTHDGFTLIYDTDEVQIGFHREANGYWGSNAVIALNLFEGSYTRAETRSSAVGDLRWWSARKDDNPFNGDISPGSYQNGNLPGSGAGQYEERPL